MVLGRLWRAMHAKDLDETQLAKQAGLHVRTVARLLDGETFDPRTIERIERTLRVELTADPRLAEALARAERAEAELAAARRRS